MFAAILLVASIVQADHPHNGTVDWLSVVGQSDVIAVAEVTRSADLVPQYKVLDGIRGVATGDAIEVGGDPVLWPLTRRVGEKFLIFAAKKPYNLDAIAIDSYEALPFLASKQPLPAYTEREVLSAQNVGRFVGGATLTVERAAALTHSLLKADEEEQRRLLLHHYLLRVFACGRAGEDVEACPLLKSDSTLDEMIGVVATQVQVHGTGTDREFLQSVGLFAGRRGSDALLHALSLELRRKLEMSLLVFRKIASVDFQPEQSPAPEEIERTLLGDSTAPLSLGALETFVQSRCDFMIDYLRSTKTETTGCLGFPSKIGGRFRMNLGLLTGRVCSPCSAALLDLAETANDDSAALAPTACSNAGQSDKLFRSKRYRPPKWSDPYYYLVWKVRMGHYDELDAALEIYSERHRSILNEQLQGLLTLALEARARAKGRALPREFGHAPNYEPYIREWVKKNADLFK